MALFRKLMLLSLLILTGTAFADCAEKVAIWDLYEIECRSQVEYENPLYDLKIFRADIISPSGKIHLVNGFWDGGQEWKIRFMPDEEGTWEFKTVCSDTRNSGLQGVEGVFECISNNKQLKIYKHGPITTSKGTYHLNHKDGTPFFWLGCTAWNGGLKSTSEEWEQYLEHRNNHGYNVIQLVGTQWRGCDVNSQGEVAFTGHGRISINPGFFKHFDEKMDRVNAHGHVAGLVLLWALPRGPGRELSPGYYLADQEAILLARYMMARYGGHHVVWILGGDGKFNQEQEDRWKYIGREVFKDKPQGISTSHPGGLSWVGKEYDNEFWYEIDGYQSSHGTGKAFVNFLNHTIAEGWKENSAKPIINLEPCYEQIKGTIFEDDVRNASYWSVFSAPPSGITYGANGIWPWIRDGEKPLNHNESPGTSTWEKSLDLPGSIQVSYLAAFMRSFNWWDLVPGQELLLYQPGETKYNHHLSVLKSKDHKQALVYFPMQLEAQILLPPGNSYKSYWFNPVTGERTEPGNLFRDRVLNIKSPFEKDAVLVLTASE